MASKHRTDGFAEAGLSGSLLTAIAALGYEEPTPVQREAIPHLLAGSDVLAHAATGTGKTAAFALPLLSRLASTPAKGRATRGLVLVPTRELAMQVSEAIHKYARGSGLDVVPVYGGASMHQQIRALDRGAAVVVATPGRALDLVRRQSLDLSALEILVLDEADEMLDMGFAEDLEALLEATPRSRQTALFAATMPRRILSIAAEHLQTPVRVTIAVEKAVAGKLPQIRQVAYLTTRAQKAAALQRVLDIEDPSSVLVFCRTRLEVDTLVETLSAHGYRAEALHGGMQQRQRDAAMQRFRSGKADLVIATDVAARGIDIDHLSHVVNYDMPSTPEVYVHRIGRTGRAGRTGTAILLVEPREHRLLRALEHATKRKIEVAQLPTVADLRAKRLELVRASIRERLLAGDLDDVRVVVESLAEEFDLIDVAAAAVKVVQAAEGTDDAQELDVPRVPEPSAARSRKGAPAGAGRRNARGGGAVVRLFVSAGRKSGVRPGDLVGAIVNEAGVKARDLGTIEIADRFSLVEVPAEAADAIVAAMRRTTVRGEKVKVRRDRSA